MPKSILAAVDLAASTDQVIAATQEYAEAFSAKVYLVHVAEIFRGSMIPLSDTEDYGTVPVTFDRMNAADRLRAERRAIQDFRQKLSDVGIDATALSIEGPTVEKLLLEIDRLKIDLVIMGSHEPGFLKDLFYGSTTKEVIREAHCPVLVLPPPSE